MHSFESRCRQLTKELTLAKENEQRLQSEKMTISNIGILRPWLYF
jgi:hypothetical protein